MSRWLLPIIFVLLAVDGSAQEPLQPADPPPEIEVPITQMRFDHPVRIEGRVLYPDTYDEAIWIQWLRVHDGKRWLSISDDRQFVVYPANEKMWPALKAFPAGTVIRLTIQRDKDGKRRVLFLEGA
ncbi:MAG: hypothetical protein ACKOBZ_05395 [Nitrospira sp.]